MQLRRRFDATTEPPKVSYCVVRFENPKSVLRAIEDKWDEELVFRVVDANLAESSTGKMKHMNVDKSGARPGELTLELLLVGLKRLPKSAKETILKDADLSRKLDQHFKDFSVTMTCRESLQSWCEVYDPLVDALATDALGQSIHRSAERHRDLGSGGWARKLVKNLPKDLPTAAIVKQIMESPVEVQASLAEGDVEAYMDTLRAELGVLKMSELKERAVAVGVSEEDLADNQMTLPEVPDMIGHLARLFDSGLGPTASSLLADAGVADATYPLAPVFAAEQEGGRLAGTYDHDSNPDTPDVVAHDFSRVDLGSNGVATAGSEDLYPAHGEPERDGVDWSDHLNAFDYDGDNLDRIEVKPVVL